MGLGDLFTDVLGGKNNAKSNVAGPDSSLYQLPGQAQSQQALQNYQQTAGNMQAQQVQGQQLASGQSQQTRDQQGQLNSMLMNAAQGNGPSAANQVLQQSQEAQIAAARSAAASAGGDSNPFLAQRAADQQMQQAMAQGGVAAAQQRAQEQQNAMGQLGGQLQGMRSQDMDLASQQAQLNQQANLANQQAGLSQNAQNQQAQQFALQNQLGLNSQQLQANMALSGAQMQNDQYNTSQNMGVAAANSAAAGAYGQAALKGVTDIAAGAAKFSDERLKTDVDRSSTDHEMGQFLDALDPASYHYLNPERHGEGKHWSIMAQSAQKTPVGKSFVLETPEGLALDTSKASMVALAALASMNKRLGKVEKKRD